MSYQHQLDNNGRDTNCNNKIPVNTIKRQVRNYRIPKSFDLDPDQRQFYRIAVLGSSVRPSCSTASRNLLKRVCSHNYSAVPTTWNPERPASPKSSVSKSCLWRGPLASLSNNTQHRRRQRNITKMLQPTTKRPLLHSSPRMSFFGEAPQRSHSLDISCEHR